MTTLPSKGKLLYHITHIDNMASILEHGLLSREKLIKNKLIFQDIADPGILSKRDLYKEALSKYVLFHFYVRNPFDCAVCHAYGKENMVIIALKRENYKVNNFRIIPSHPLDSNSPDIYTYEEGLNKIRWDILDMATGRDYSNPEIKKACMAECVMDYVIPAEAFDFVFVCDEAAKQKIENLKNAEKIKIQLSPYMFP